MQIGYDSSYSQTNDNFAKQNCTSKSSHIVPTPRETSDGLIDIGATRTSNPQAFHGIRVVETRIVMMGKAWLAGFCSRTAS